MIGDDDLRARVLRLAADLRAGSRKIDEWARWPTRTAHEREQAAIRSGDLVAMALRVEALLLPTKSIDELIAASSLGQPYAEPDPDELERAMDALAEIDAATPKGGSER